MADTTTVRVHKHTRDRITRLARESGVSVATVIDQAVENLESDHFWDAFDDAVEQHRADGREWTAEQRERDLWEKATAKIGLDAE